MKITFIDFSRRVAEGFIVAHGCKPWVTNSSMVPHTLGILTANIIYRTIILFEYANKCQVNVRSQYSTYEG